jgi:hypothetical protein
MGVLERAKERADRRKVLLLGSRVGKVWRETWCGGIEIVAS